MSAALDQGASPDACGDFDEEGGFDTALVQAVGSRNSQAVRVLLKAGADPNLIGQGTPMSLAVATAQIEVCDMLLAAGAQLETSPGDDLLMHEALNSGSARVVALLLDAGAPMIANPYLRGKLVRLARSSNDESLAKRIEVAP